MDGQSIKIITIFKVKVTGRRGDNFTSDIALDDFKLFYCRKYYYLIFILYLKQIKKRNKIKSL